ncbi:MAG: Histidine ABC transporter, permease protein HisM (TC 3.A.1.3.1) [uncultured Paraburkholderia sp.]|nr:MAG: Histidine ABC transporter, permease protein HisM (TC 3.A.1.3.1) [uncultured Paraburkholderia sp.]
MSIGLGFCLSIPLAVARVSKKKWLAGLVWLYTYIFRGTPLYVQLLLCYTGLYSLEIVRNHELTNAFFRDGMHCTLLAFTLNTCAYTTEIFAGAIKATPYGEIEAARAYGMSSFTLYRRVILPSALRRALPYYSNEVILMLHATTVAFTATVPDILKIARRELGNLSAVQCIRHRRPALSVHFFRARVAVPPRGAPLARLPAAARQITGPAPGT